MESTWLYHEIGRCHLELGEHQDAKEFGEKSLEAAKDAGDNGWQLHACVLIAQSEGVYKYFGLINLFHSRNIELYSSFRSYFSIVIIS